MRNRIGKFACLITLLPVALLLASCLLPQRSENKQPNNRILPAAAIDPIDPLLLFSELKGRKVITGGWADYKYGGEGLTYADPEYPIIISDELFQDPIEKFEAFLEAIDLKDQQVFIIVSGDVDFSRGKITDAPGHTPGVSDYSRNRQFSLGSSNTTIIGINNARLKYGGLRILDRQNIIIRNITFWDARDTQNDPGLDHLQVDGESTFGVWLNHVKFTSGINDFRIGGDWHDTLLGFDCGTATISWCEFTNANEVLLVGGGDGGERPRKASEEELYRLRARRRVTLHHNYFHSARDRMPQTRSTQMHIYNNFYRNIWWHAMAPGVNAHFVVQNNFFHSIRGNRAVHWRTLHKTRAGAVLWHSGNTGAAISKWRSWPAVVLADSNPMPWNPLDFYTYTLDEDVNGLLKVIPGRAGPSLKTIEDFLGDHIIN